MELTVEMIWVLSILAFTIFLFVSEIVRVDIAAIIIMVFLGLTTVLPGVPDLIDPAILFNGFGSNAVISIIAVIIIGAGLDKTGVMSVVAAFILKIGGKTEKTIIPIISGTVGIISSFMQNVGAAALFLPVVNRISARSGIPTSRLLMPMGFSAICGGTMTMIGSSPLILLNDLIITSNTTLVAQGLSEMDIFSLFSVAPIGAVMILAGILYFIIAGKYVLPSGKDKKLTSSESTVDYLKRIYGVDYALNELHVTADSLLLDKTLDELEVGNRLRIVAIKSGDIFKLAPSGLARDVEIKEGDIIGVIASNWALKKFSKKYKTERRKNIEVFLPVLSRSTSGMAEVVIPPASNIVGKSCRDIEMRKVYGLTVMAIHRQGKTIAEGILQETDGSEDAEEIETGQEEVRDLPLIGGDTLICHVNWNQLAKLEKNPNFVVVSTEYPHEETRPNKVIHALVFLVIALGLVLLTDIRLSIALFVGALGMILTGVIHIDEAYESVSWKTVFLLASLIPLGIAVETTGTAQWIATHTIELVGNDVSPFILQIIIAILATFFTLVMSNVGATVLLVPLAVNIAIQAQVSGISGADPAMFALTVALATSNSFLIPTHQVNALIMGPAGYKVKDFLKAGGIMTLLFLFVMLGMLKLFY
ncbi:MAG: SLC13 family permease [Thiohalomonadales bacterium]